jgi:EipB-like
MRPTVGCLAFGLGLMAAAASQAASPTLVAHKAVYDLSLFSGQGSRGPDSAKGRIAYNFTGDACEGYTMSFRQVTVLQASEGEPRMSDLRSTTFEDGEGANFKFRTEHQSASGPAKIVDGNADRRAGALAVAIARPKKDRLDVSADVLFPSAHMRKLIGAAQAGDALLSVKVYDGSDDGLKVYDTLSVIGRKIEDGGRPAEEPALKAGLDKAARWPVTVSYFTEGSGERIPVYTVSFDLFDNGIIGALKLDYGSFVLKGEMKQLDVIAGGKCQR